MRHLRNKYFSILPVLAFVLAGFVGTPTGAVFAASQEEWVFNEDPNDLHSAMIEKKGVSLSISCSYINADNFTEFAIRDPGQALLRPTTQDIQLNLFVDGSKFEVKVIETHYPWYSSAAFPTVALAKDAFPKKALNALMSGEELVVIPASSPQRSITFSLAGAEYAITKALEQCR